MVEEVMVDVEATPDAEAIAAEEVIEDHHIVDEAMVDEDMYGVTSQEADVHTTLHTDEALHPDIEEHTGVDTKNGLS